MNWRYDDKTDAAYLRFSEAAIEESDEVSPGVILDFDAENRVVGIEILNASAKLPREAIGLAAAE